MNPNTTHTEETKTKMREAKLRWLAIPGNKERLVARLSEWRADPANREKLPRCMLGRHWSPAQKELRRQWSKAHGFQPGYKPSPEVLAKLRQSHLGKRWSEEFRQNYLSSERVKNRKKSYNHATGPRHGLWKGGVTKESERIRKSIQYRLWREAVFSRDTFTCQERGKVGGKLQAHHILSFATHPELRFAIDNGKTLCQPCHAKIHPMLRRAEGSE
jgi:5-methylcytosine-specific restriction endonuclease McrA